MVCERTDTDIAKDAICLLECDVHFWGGKVMVTVEDGLLTLEGTMECNFQKVAAEKAMQCIRGVKAVANLIEVAPEASPFEIQKRAEEALSRGAEVDARQIKATTADQVAVLTGNARSWSEGEDVDRAAWSVAGVVRVGDLIVVEPGVTWRRGRLRSSPL